MKAKTKFVVCCTIFLFIGVAGTIFVYNNFNLYKTKETKVTRVKITEKNTIKKAINKVKDSVFVVETYDQFNNKVGTGTGFVYKIDNNFIFSYIYAEINGTEKVVIKSIREDFIYLIYKIIYLTEAILYIICIIYEIKYKRKNKKIK